MHVTPSFPHMHDYPPACGQQIKYTKDQIPKKSSNRTYGVSFITTVARDRLRSSGIIAIIILII